MITKFKKGSYKLSAATIFLVFSLSVSSCSPMRRIHQIDSLSLVLILKHKQT